MSYRDDTDALRARVDELEGELGRAEHEIARLRGEGPRDEAAERLVERSALLGVPVRQVSTRTLDHEITEEGFEAMADVLGGRDVSLVGRRLRAPGVEVRSRSGKTTIQIDANARGNASGTAAGSVALGVFLALASFGLLHDVAGVGEAALMGLVPLFVALTFLLSRPLHQRAANEKLRAGRARLEQLSDLAAAHPVERPAVRARVAVEEPLEDAAEDAAEVSAGDELADAELALEASRD